MRPGEKLSRAPSSFTRRVESSGFIRATNTRCAHALAFRFRLNQLSNCVFHRNWAGGAVNRNVGWTGVSVGETSARLCTALGSTWATQNGADQWRKRGRIRGHRSLVAHLPCPFIGEDKLFAPDCFTSAIENWSSQQINRLPVDRPIQVWRIQSVGVLIAGVTWQ